MTSCLLLFVFEVSLSKFVRLAGDLLPPPLFVPYVEMLTGLSTGRQCAHFGYALLKNNGSHSGTSRSAVSHTERKVIHARLQRTVSLQQYIQNEKNV